MVPNPHDPRTDAQLIELIRAGGSQRRSAFDALVRRHEPWVARMLTALLGDRMTAEDVAQDAFVRAYLAADRFPPANKFRAWLRTVATNAAFNQRRASQTRARHTEKYGEVLRESLDHETALSNREALQVVLGELAYPIREILVLRYVEEMQVPEIAKLLGLGLSAAKMRLKRAREEFLETYRAHERRAGRPR